MSVGLAHTRLLSAVDSRGRLAGMERQAVIRRVQRTASLSFTILAIAAVALWARSFWRMDVVSRIGMSIFVVNSTKGQLQFYYQPMSRFPSQPSSWGFGTTMAAGRLFQNNVQSTSLFVPYWCPALLAATGAFLPYARIRFSLRTMLIATTLIALVLGLTAWVGR